jgi:CMP-N-acetylneuraminic acid synthetase
VAHVMPPERSIDIDTLDDFETFERLVARGLT